ncbi:MAG TPA: hypothetical protein VGF55_24710 [Gemmataceae bacterium]|jgi:hypothetical protein
MAKRGGGERGGGEKSNTGLIVTLVFFILTTIGFGVWTYMAYSAKADAVKDAKAAADKASASDKKAEEAEARRLGLKVAAGVADPAERARFAALKGSHAAAVDGDVGALYGQLRTQLNVKDLPAWSVPATDAPPKSLLVLSTDLQKDAATAATKQKAAEDELTKERESFKAAVEDLQAKLKTAQENLAKANKTVVDEQSTRAAGSDKKDEEIKKLSEQLAQVKLELDNTGVEKDREINKLKAQVETSRKVRDELRSKYGPLLEKLDQVRQARPELRDLGELHDLLTRALEGQQSLVNDTPKGAIVEVRNGQVYINLGSADNAKPGLAFSVLPAGSTGRAAAATPRKGAVEVVSVLEPHLSVAKVVEAANPVRDPLLKGDLLFNPAWSPNSKEHVALAGIIDLNSDGIDDTPDLIRALEKQGVVVDAWLDPKDRTIKGPGMTERTTYLVVGERPVVNSAAASVENNPLAQAQIELIGKITEMEGKARDLGVQKVPYRRFLSLIGYRLPKGGQPADYSASSYLRGSGGLKPAESKEKEGAEKPK